MNPSSLNEVQWGLWVVHTEIASKKKTFKKELGANRI